MLLSIASAVFILAVLIIIHEAGHFAAAKSLGVRVVRFSVGYPPKIWGYRLGETEYAIGATPFGGYVRMLGDEVADEPGQKEATDFVNEIEGDLLTALAWHEKPKAGNNAPSRGEENLTPTDDAGKPVGREDQLLAFAIELGKARDTVEYQRMAVQALGRAPSADEALLLAEIASAGSVKSGVEALIERRPASLMEHFRRRAFPTQPLWRRTVIVLAGPLANIVAAPLLLVLLFLYGVPVLLPVVGQVQKSMPAYAGGIRPGDRIRAINGHPVFTWDALSTAVKASGGKKLVLDIRRKQGTSAGDLTITVQPIREAAETVYGTKVTNWVIGVLPRGDEMVLRLGPIEAVDQALTTCRDMIGALVIGFAQIIDGSTPIRQALGGPIMIAQMAGREAQRGLANLGMFMVMLSLELGIINLVPIPMLDGGHLLFFACEALRGRPLKLHHREIALQVGLFVLAILMAFVIFNDVSRIVRG